jgi:acyl-coenzyme A thioesterase PaaI-like protein
MLETLIEDWPEAGWTRVSPFPFSAARAAFAGLTADEGRLELAYYRRPADGALVAVADFGPRAEGAPGLVHGGMILTVLDEALGAACWVAGHPSLTVRLSTEFRLSVPLGARCLVETRVTGARHRLVSAEGTLRGRDGTLYASAEGRFMRLDDATYARLFGRPASPKSPEKS